MFQDLTLTFQASIYECQNIKKHLWVCMSMQVYLAILVGNTLAWLGVSWCSDTHKFKPERLKLGPGTLK